MSEKTPSPEISIHGDNNKDLVDGIVDLLVQSGWDKSRAIAEIANETDKIEEERKELAGERGLPETATWDEIIAHDKNRSKN